jgi:hypothetical protein
MGVVKLRLLLGPVGARNEAAGPRGGERGTAGRAGDLSFGVDLADSCSLCLYAKTPGDRSRGGGERLLSRLAACVKACLLGCTGGEERRELLPELLTEDLSESRGAGEGDRRLIGDGDRRRTGDGERRLQL